MTGRPAATLLHLGAGLANGVGNLHNARRALSPVVNLVGEMSTWHSAADPVLAMDIQAIAKTVSGLVRTTTQPHTIQQDVEEAVRHSMTRRVEGSRISTLVVPHDIQRQKTTAPSPVQPVMAQFGNLELQMRSEETLKGGNSMVDQLDRAVAALGAHVHAAATTASPASSSCCLMLGTELCRDEESLTRAARIAAKTGCVLMVENAFSRVDRGCGGPHLIRLPYFPQDALKCLSQFSSLVFLGCRPPVAMFGYEDGISQVVDYEKQNVVELSGSEDWEGVLRHLEAALQAQAVTPQLIQEKRPQLPSGRLSAVKLCSAVAALQPRGCVMVDESLTSGGAYWDLSQGCPPFSHLTLTGGAIGAGPPLATGAALACPDRTVINFQADGSAMYSLQALWTQQREKLHVITIICANCTYQILKIEQMKQKLPGRGNASSSLTSLGDPEINWVQLAEGMGVKAARVHTVEEFVSHMQIAIQASAPYLIEARLV